MNPKKQTNLEDLQVQVDALRDELESIKGFLMHISTEAQSITFDECSIENVIIQQPLGEESD